MTSLAEMSDNCESKFTSLVRARGLISFGQTPSPWCGTANLTFHRGSKIAIIGSEVSPVNHSDSDLEMNHAFR